MIYRYIFIIIIVFVIGCASKDIQIQEDLTFRFDKGLKYFENKKYTRSKAEFDYIIMVDPGSKLANDSEYYMAESMFELEEYKEASTLFDKYIRFSTDLIKIEKARYKICRCAIELSNSYQRDQSQTLSAIYKLQLFIEDFPTSDNVISSESAITSLRYNLARKDFESGRMYLKLEEYESAIIYFQLVLDEYYDTVIADEARKSIVFAYLLDEERDEAIRYLDSQKQNFFSMDNFYEAQSFIDNSESGINLIQYYNIFK